MSGSNQNSHSSKSHAEKFVEKHKLLPILTDMFNSLVTDKNRYPEVYMIKHLSSFLSEEEKAKHGIFVPRQETKVVPVVKFPSKITNELVQKHLTKYTWDMFKYKVTKFGKNINDILSNEREGFQITDPDCLYTFRDLLSRVIKDVHKVDHDPKPEKFVKKRNENFKDISSSSLHLVKLEYYRNLRHYPFVKFCDVRTLNQIQSEIITRLHQLDKSRTLQDYSGRLISYNEDTEKYLDTVETLNLDISYDEYKDSVLYVMTADNTSVVILINNVAHFRIIGAQTQKIDISELYEKTNYVHDILCDLFDFAFDEEFGFVNSDIKLTGRAAGIEGSLKLVNIPSEVLPLLNLQHKDIPHFYTWRVIQTLGKSEEKFAEEISNELYNIDYIESHPNDIAIEDLSNNNIFSKGTKLYECISEAYVTAYSLEKYKHFPNDNYNLNRLVIDLLSGKNHTKAFKQFPNFFNHFMIKFRNISEEVTQGLAYLTAKSNVINIRGSLLKLKTSQLIDIKSLRMKIRRNIKGYDFNSNLTTDQQDELVNLIGPSISGHNKMNMTVRTDLNDHITFDFDYTEGDIVDSISNFFDSYSQVTASLENKGIFYLNDPNLGFITHDIEYLGTGFSFAVDIVNHTDKDLTLTPSQEEEGFSVENSKGLLTLICNLNLSVSADRIFEVTHQMIEGIKVPIHSHPQEVTTVASGINNPTVENENKQEDDGPVIESI